MRPLDSIVGKTCFLWLGIQVRFQTREENNHEDSEEFVSSSKEDCSSSEAGIASFGSLFHELGFNLQADVISEWLDNDANDSGVQIFTDVEICECVSKSPSDS